MHVFWGMKKLVQLKFVQLLLLNRVKAKGSKNCAAQGFHYINSFISFFFWTQFKNLHLWGPCSLRPRISRPYCIFYWLCSTELYKFGHATKSSSHSWHLLSDNRLTKERDLARTELEVCKHDLDRLEVDLRVQNDENKRLKVTWVVQFQRECYKIS